MSWLDRLRDLLRRDTAPALTVDAPDLAVVAESFDPAEADSAVLARSAGWAADAEAVLRHHLLLPAAAVEHARTVLAQDGWELREVPDGQDAGKVRLHALRVQLLDPVRCARERSRMAGLAQRLGGDSLGWDALQPRS